jgi:hypothetical protein
MVGVMTLGPYLEQWIEHVRAHRQPVTIRNYAVKCRRFTAELGSTRIDKLRSHQLDTLYRRWLAEGMSPATVKANHAVLSAALGQAVKWGLIERSVAPLVTLPTVESRRMMVPDADTVRLFIKESEQSDPVLSAAIMLAALTGCRRGELLGSALVGCRPGPHGASCRAVGEARGRRSSSPSRSDQDPSEPTRLPGSGDAGSDRHPSPASRRLGGRRAC